MTYIRQISKTTSVLLAVLVTTFVVGCAGDDLDVVDPSSKLCSRVGGGVGARVSGGADAVDVCVSNDATDASVVGSGPARYDVDATWIDGDVTIQIQMSFYVHDFFPVILNVTPSPNLVNADDVYFSYRETKAGVYNYASSNVVGIFTLAVSDGTIAAASFDGLEITLQDGTGADAGMRRIEEGFVNVTSD